MFVTQNFLFLTTILSVHLSIARVRLSYFHPLISATNSGSVLVATQRSDMAKNGVQQRSSPLPHLVYQMQVDPSGKEQWLILVEVAAMVVFLP
ncbi:hypothetical protein E2C01_029375 [Portunus trituberculatus]|uniref:Secreted protein n=1 Tax=Portunus trituberculatus TaxID=210409 RepID=A0A5B7ERT0_PORTR|nr:hypothetical protein [Portunus trituberculatus]